MERIVIDITSDPTKLQATIDKLNQMGAVDAKNAAQFKKNNQDLNAGLQNTSKIAGAVSEKIGNIGKTIVAAFAVERIYSFAKEIVNVRAEFQKFEAQLTTALGSQSEAQQTLIRIQTFAAKTPFSVKELTESFVRLANRGINATNSQLTKLGDVASALGKPMQQVIEAIVDINNTERWNELGIKVKTNGDKITGTFKGMTVTMDKTEKGAMQMIEAFGGMETVAGGMDRQMNTLGGSISNLGDNWTNLMNSMGKSSEGVFNFILSGLNDLLSGINSYISGLNQADETLEKMGKKELKSKSFGFGSSAFYGFGGLAIPGGFLAGATGMKYDPLGLEDREKYNVQLQSQQEDLNKILAGDFKFKEWEEKRLKKTIEGKELLKLQQDELKNQLAVIANLYKTGGISFESAEAQITLVKAAANQLKENTKAHKEHFNPLKNSTSATKSFTEILPPLIKKLEELKFAYRELDVSRLKDHEKLDAQRKLDEEKIVQEYDAEVKRITDLNNEKKLKQGEYQKGLVLLQEILTQQRLNIEKKYKFATEDLDREIAKRHAEHLKKMNDMDIGMMEMGRDNEEEIYDLRLKSTEEYYDKLIELEQDQEKREELMQQKKLELAKIEDTEKKRKEKAIEDERNEARRHEIAMMEITEQGEKEILKKKMEYSAEDLDRLREAFGEGSDEYQKEYNHYLELEAEYNKKSKGLKKEWIKDWVDGLNQVLQAVLEAMNNMVEAEMNANNIRMDNQREVLETQRVLASKGLENTLAFEQKRNDEMAKQQIELQRKQQRIKELQIFLNAMAKFAEEDPKSALTKALSLIAATKVAETIFAEEGAIVGTHETKFRGQRHRSGRDRIAVVEDGEVILPKAKAMEMGLNSKAKFSQFLKTPFSEKIMPMAVAQVDNYDKLARELKELKEIVKNKQEVTINWDNFDTRIETRIKGSLKEVTKVKKHRI